MIRAVPAFMPVITPVGASIAASVLLLDQVPPFGALLREAELPGQRTIIPVIADGRPFTVNDVVAVQPVFNVYVIVVEPALRAVTIPLAEPTVATDGTLVDHVPLPLELRVVVVPAHMAIVPVIADGNGLTVMIATDTQPVLSL